MRTLTAIILTAAIAATATAQPPRGGRGGGFGGGGPLSILSSPDVQKELKITDEQKTKLKEFQDKQTKARQEAFPQGQRPDPEKMAEFRKKTTEDTAAFMKDALTEEQSKRLKQINLQQSLKSNPAGVFFTISFGQDGISYGDPTETGKALKVTDEQKEKIKSVATQLGKDMADLRPQGGGRPSADDQKKMEALRKEANEKIMEVFTEDQKKMLEELKGKPFEGKIENPMGGGRRPGGAGGAPGAGNRRPGGN